MASSQEQEPESEQEGSIVLRLLPADAIAGQTNVFSLTANLTDDITGRELRKLAQNCTAAAFGPGDGVLQITCKMVPRTLVAAPVQQRQQLPGPTPPSSVPAPPPASALANRGTQNPNATPPSAQPQTTRPRTVAPPLQSTPEEPDSSPSDLIEQVDLTQKSTAPLPSKTQQSLAVVQVERTQPQVNAAQAKRPRATSEEFDGFDFEDIDLSSDIAEVGSPPKKKARLSETVNSGDIPSIANSGNPPVTQRSKATNAVTGGWTAEEDEAVRKGYAAGLNTKQIIKTYSLNRSASALRNRKRNLGESNTKKQSAAGPSRTQRQSTQATAGPSSTQRQSTQTTAGPSGSQRQSIQCTFARSKGKGREGEPPSSKLQLVLSGSAAASSNAVGNTQNSTQERVAETQVAKSNVTKPPPTTAPVGQNAANTQNIETRTSSPPENQVESIETTPEVQPAKQQEAQVIKKPTIASEQEQSNVADQTASDQQSRALLTTSIERRVRCKQTAIPEDWESIVVRSVPGEAELIFVGTQTGPAAKIHREVYETYRDHVQLRKAIEESQRMKRPTDVQEFYDYNKWNIRRYLAVTAKDDDELARLKMKKKDMDLKRRKRHGLPSPPRKAVTELVKVGKEGSVSIFEPQVVSRTDSDDARRMMGSAEDESILHDTFTNKSRNEQGKPQRIRAEELGQVIGEEDAIIEDDDEHADNPLQIQKQASIRISTGFDESASDMEPANEQLLWEAAQSELADKAAVGDEDDSSFLNLVSDDAVAAYDENGEFRAMVPNRVRARSPIVLPSEVGSVGDGEDRDAIRQARRERKRARRSHLRNERRMSGSSFTGSDDTVLSVRSSVPPQAVPTSGLGAVGSMGPPRRPPYLSNGITQPSPKTPQVASQPGAATTGSMAPPPRPSPLINGGAQSALQLLRARAQSSTTAANSMPPPPRPSSRSPSNEATSQHSNTKRRLPKAAQPEPDLETPRLHWNLVFDKPRPRWQPPPPGDGLLYPADEEDSESQSSVSRISKTPRK